MNATAIIGLISVAARWASLAIQIGTDAAPFIGLIEKWSAGGVNPTQADIDLMNAMAKPFLDKLNDTSRDK